MAKRKNDTAEVTEEVVTEEVTESTEESAEESPAKRTRTKTEVPADLQPTEKEAEDSEQIALNVLTVATLEEAQVWLGRDSIGRATVSALMGDEENLPVIRCAEEGENLTFLTEYASSSSANLFPRNFDGVAGELIGVLLDKDLVAVCLAVVYNRGTVRPFFSLSSDSEDYVVKADTAPSGSKTGSGSGRGRPSAQLIQSMRNAIENGVDRDMAELIFSDKMDLYDRVASGEFDK